MPVSLIPVCSIELSDETLSILYRENGKGLEYKERLRMGYPAIDHVGRFKAYVKYVLHGSLDAPIHLSIVQARKSTSNI